MRLFIAEKPSVGRAIAESLGVSKKTKNYTECSDGSIVTWCFGHMFELAEPDEYTSDDVPVNSKGRKVWRFDELPIFPENFKLHPKSDAKEQLKVIKQLLKDADEVVNCGDPDREGQLLVDELLEEYKYKKTVKRYWANAQDATSVSRALQGLKSNDEFISLGVAARQRSYADWIVGMNLTRAYSVKAKTLVTMGRVQSPTLKLVVDRDRAIANFKPVDFFRIFAEQSVTDSKFVSELQTQELDCTDEENRIISKEKADEIVAKIENKEGEILSFNKDPKKKNQPLGYSLSDLTAKASSLWGFSAQQTLDVCQSLYEKKLTSYPRTDCSYLPEAQYGDAENVLKAIKETYSELSNLVDGADRTIHSKTWNTEKTTAHHAIIPTMQSGDFNALSDDEKKVYGLVARNFISQFYEVHEYFETEIISKIEDYKFRASGITVTKEGWCCCFKNEKLESEDDGENEEKHGALPEVNAGDKTLCTDVKTKTAKTKAPARFTEGTLIKAMENIYKYIDDDVSKKLLKDGDGIGTSATRAGIISELKRKNYLASKGKYIISTEIGQKAIDVIPERVKSPVLTAIFESMLSKIEKKEISESDFMTKQKKLVEDEINKVKGLSLSIAPKKETNVSTKYTCKVCGKGLIRRESAKKKGMYWWGCSGYPECKQTYFDDNGKPKYEVTEKK